MPSPTSTASWSPSPCLTSSSPVIAPQLDLHAIDFRHNLTFVLYGRIVSAGMTDDLGRTARPRASIELVAAACERAGLDDFGDDSMARGSCARSSLSCRVRARSERRRARPTSTASSSTRCGTGCASSTTSSITPRSNEQRIERPLVVAGPSAHRHLAGAAICSTRIRSGDRC